MYFFEKSAASKLCTQLMTEVSFYLKLFFLWKLSDWEIGRKIGRHPRFVFVILGFLCILWDSYYVFEILIMFLHCLVFPCPCFAALSFTLPQSSLHRVDSIKFIFSFEALTSALTWFYSNFHGVSCWAQLVAPWTYIRKYFHYWVVAAAGTSVNSGGNFGTYDGGILFVMVVGIGSAAIVIVAVVVGVGRNGFYFRLQRFFIFVFSVSFSQKFIYESYFLQ